MVPLWRTKRGTNLPSLANLKFFTVNISSSFHFFLQRPFSFTFKNEKKVQNILWFSNVISNYLHQKLHFFVKLKCQNKITPSSGSAFLGLYVYYNYIIQLPICFWHFALLLFTKLGYGILRLIPNDIVIM